MSGRSPYPRIDLVDDVHALGHRPERREALPVQRRAVVLEVDEELRGAGLGPAVANTIVPALVALLHRVVLDVGVFPGRVDRGIGMQSELHDEVRHDAEEGGVGEEAVLSPGCRSGRRRCGAHSRCTSTTKSPCVVVNFTRYNSGALGLQRRGIQQRVGARRGAACPFGRSPVLWRARLLRRRRAAVFGADLAGGGVWARSAAPEMAKISRAFISAHFTMG